MFFLKNTNVKRNFPRGGTSALWGQYYPHIQKYVHYFTISIINNYLNFKMIGLKYFILSTIACNCVLCQCHKEIENFQQTTKPLECYAPASNEHQLMQLNMKFHAIMSISFCANAVINFLSLTGRPKYRQTFCKNKEIVFKPF